MVGGHVWTCGRLRRGARRLSAVVATVVALALTAVVLPSAATAVAPARDDSAAAAQRELDGRTLARGLFFLSGPTLEVIPELTTARAAALDAGYVPDPVVETQLLDAMQQLRPGVFRSFADAMHSGDHVEVRQVLTETSDLLLVAAETVFGGPGGQDPAAKAFIGPVVVMAVVAVSWLAVGVSVVAAGMMAVALSAPVRDTVPHDRTVSAIVRNLG